MLHGYYFFQNNSVLKSLLSAFTLTQNAVADSGEGPGGPAPPYLRVRMTAPPLSEGLNLSLKCSCRVMEKIPNKFFHGGLTLILISFGDFFKFQFMSILSIHGNRQQETVSMPNYSPGPGCSNVR